MNWFDKYNPNFLFFKTAASQEEYLRQLTEDGSIISYIMSQTGEVSNFLTNELRKNPSLSLEQIRNISLPNKFKKINEQSNFMSQIDILSGNRFDNVFKNWLFKSISILSRQLSESLIDIFNEKYDNIAQIYDWYEQNNVGNDIFSYNFDRAQELSQAWHKNLADKSIDSKWLRYEEKNIVYGPIWKDNRGHIVDKYNGWTIQEVKSDHDLDVEGQKMGHCVGGYYSKVVFGRVKIYSLRDLSNQPHVTIETSGDGSTVHQIKGKHNQDVTYTEYEQQIALWIQDDKNAPKYNKSYSELTNNKLNELDYYAESKDDDDSDIFDSMFFSLADTDEDDESAAFGLRPVPTLIANSLIESVYNYLSSYARDEYPLGYVDAILLYIQNNRTDENLIEAEQTISSLISQYNKDLEKKYKIKASDYSTTEDYYNAIRSLVSTYVPKERDFLPEEYLFEEGLAADKERFERIVERRRNKFVPFLSTSKFLLSMKSGLEELKNQKKALSKNWFQKIAMPIKPGMWNQYGQTNKLLSDIEYVNPLTKHKIAPRATPQELEQKYTGVHVSPDYNLAATYANTFSDINNPPIVFEIATTYKWRNDVDADLFSPYFDEDTYNSEAGIDIEDYILDKQKEGLSLEDTISEVFDTFMNSDSMYNDYNDPINTVHDYIKSNIVNTSSQSVANYFYNYYPDDYINHFYKGFILPVFFGEGSIDKNIYGWFIQQMRFDSEIPDQQIVAAYSFHPFHEDILEFEDAGDEDTAEDDFRTEEQKSRKYISIEDLDYGSGIGKIKIWQNNQKQLITDVFQVFYHGTAYDRAKQILPELPDKKLIQNLISKSKI